MKKPEVAQTPTTTTEMDVESEECYSKYSYLAVWYSSLDILNLSIGIISDIFLYIGVKQSRLAFKKSCVRIFLAASAIRELLHLISLCLHLVRCSPETYGYELTVRVLVQYMIYGTWIVAEYLRWLSTGCFFVPRRGLMEPPDINERNPSNVPTKLTLSSGTSSNVSDDQLESNTQKISSRENLEEADGDGVTRKKKKKKRISKRSGPVTSPDNGQSETPSSLTLL